MTAALTERQGYHGPAVNAANEKQVIGEYVTQETTSGQLAADEQAALRGLEALGWSLGFEGSPQRQPGHLVWRVQRQGRTLLVGYRRRSTPPYPFTFYVAVSGAFLDPVAFRPSHPWPYSAGKGRVLSGDLRFDGQVYAYGPELMVRALLTDSFRGLLTRLMADGPHAGIRLRNGGLTLRGAPGVVFGAEHGVRLVATLLELAGDAELDDETLLPRLLDVATRDPARRSRAGAAELLLELLRHEDIDSQVGMGRALAESSHVLPRHRLEALNLLRDYAPNAVAPLLDNLLHAEHDEIVRVAVRFAGDIGATEAVPRLMAIGRDGPPEWTALVAETLGRIGAQQAEVALLEWLEHTDIRVRRAVVAALGRAGTPRSVNSLVKIGKGVFADRSVKRTAKKAIERIRARFGNIEGQLALVSGEGGELSLPASEDSWGDDADMPDLDEKWGPSTATLLDDLV